METPDWFKKLFERIDSKDADGFSAFLAEDATFQFGNAAGVDGKKAIYDTVATFFTSIHAIHHKVLETWVYPETVICRGMATYTRHDLSQLTVPFANIFKTHDNLIREYLIYVDISDLYPDT